MKTTKKKVNVLPRAQQVNRRRHEKQARKGQNVNRHASEVDLVEVPGVSNERNVPQLLPLVQMLMLELLVEETKMSISEATPEKQFTVM